MSFAARAMPEEGFLPALRCACAEFTRLCYTACIGSGVVQLVAHQTLDLAILVRVQAPEPNLARPLMASTLQRAMGKGLCPCFCVI